MKPGPSWRTPAAIGSGIMLALAYPPVNWFGLAWIGLIPLVYIARRSSPRDGLKLGFIAGLVFWLISMFWLTTLAVTGVPWSLAVLAWLLLSLYCAVYVSFFLAVLCAWFRKWGDGDWRMNLLLVFFAPAHWVGLEYIRGRLFTGFPWSTLAVSQHANPLVCQIADIGGIYLVSAFIVLMNMVLAFTVIHYRGVKVGRRYRTHPELMAGLLVLAMVFSYGVKSFARRRPVGNVFNISGVQLNIEQSMKWPEDGAAGIRKKLQRLSEMAVAPWVDLIVWPETAAPSFILFDADCSALVSNLLTNDVPILVGSMDARVEQDGENLYFNSTMLFDPAGTYPVIYNKQHLVPFGERIPLRQIFPFLDRLVPDGWSLTPGKESTIFTLKKRGQPADTGTAFGSMICFEDIFPYIAREYVRKGARLLINQTNDAWFDPSSGPRRHMANSMFRCIENRVPVLRVTNTGMTCLIDPLGRVVKDSTVQRFVNASGGLIFDPLDSAGKEGFISATVDVPPADMELTIYTRYGDVFAIACAVVSLMSIVLVIGWPAVIRFAFKPTKAEEKSDA